MSDEENDLRLKFEQEIMQVIPSLGNEFTELAGVVCKHMLDYEEK
jgi:hypothetical protein